MTSSPPPGGARGRFPTTQWSLVLAAGLSDAGARKALAELCQAYWYPLYAFVRRNYPTKDAQDLVQGFFARFLEKDYLQLLGPEKGKFRSYLLGALKNYIANDLKRAAALKRGGGQPLISLEDLEQGEKRFLDEPATEDTPETEFEVKWALTVLEQVLSRLQAEYERAERAEAYATLKTFLPGGDQDLSYETAADRIGAPVDRVRVTIHRLRRRFGEVLRSEIGQTLADPREIDEEIRYFISVLGRSQSM